MVNLLGYKPADDAFDELFRGFLMRPMCMDSTQEMQIKLDVNQDDKNYTVHPEMPGVKKEDIQVSIDGNQVGISAEVKNEKEVKGSEKVLRSERFYGRVSRVVPLAQDVDNESAAAKYNNGVLELTLPKKAAAMSKRLTVS